MSLHRARSNNNPLALQPASVMQRLESDGAADFAASSKEYLASTSSAFNVGTSDFSVCMWARQTSSVTSPVYMCKASTSIGGTGSWMIYGDSGTKLSVAFAAGGTAIGCSSFNIVANATWVMITVTFDRDGNMSIWKNDAGSPAASSDISSQQGDVSNAFPLMLSGRNYLDGYAYDGRMDSVGFWTRVLTADDIAALYNAGAGLTYDKLSAGLKTGLLSWWDLDEDTGLRYDSHGTNHLTPGALPIISPTVKNGGFETAGAGGADVFADWTEYVQGSSTANRDTSDKYAGDASCRFDVDGSSSAVYITAQNACTVGHRYNSSFYAKGSAANSNVYVSSNVASQAILVPLTTSWAQYTQQFAAVGTGYHIVRNASAGMSLWVDNVTLTSTGPIRIDGITAGTATFGDAVKALAMSDGVTYTQATLAKRPMATMVNGWPAMQFDGVDDALVASGDLVGTGDVTIVAVIRPTGLGAGSAGRILSNGQFGIYQATTERLTVSSDSGTTSLTSANNSVQLNRKYVLVTTRSATGVASIWLNGSLLTSGASGTPAAGSDTYVGNRAAGDRAFQGMISYLSIHKRILSVPEIQALTRYLSQNRAPDTWSFSVSAGTFNVAISNAGTTTWQLPDGTTTTTATGVALNTTLTQGQVNAVATWENATSRLTVTGASAALQPMLISDWPARLKQFQLNDMSVVMSGRISEMPRGMNHFYCVYPATASVINGTIDELPKGLAVLYIVGWGNGSSLSGRLVDLPRTLTQLYINGGGVWPVTGALEDLPQGVTWLLLNNLTGGGVGGQLSSLNRDMSYLSIGATGAGSNVTGSIGDVPSGCSTVTLFDAIGNITGSLANLGSAWYLTQLRISGQGLSTVTGSIPAANIAPSATMVRLYDCSFSPEDTDGNIIAVSTATAGQSGSGKLAVFETNRTSASDAAVADLTGRGWSVTFA